MTRSGCRPSFQEQKKSLLKCPVGLLGRRLAGVKPTIHDCWSDFARWEMARDFADDPSHPAKAAIAWIDTMELLRADLDEFAGLAKNECREALDRAYDAFARLEHSPELVRAIELWRESRLAE